MGKRKHMRICKGKKKSDRDKYVSTSVEHMSCVRLSCTQSKVCKHKCATAHEGKRRDLIMYLVISGGREFTHREKLT